MQINIRIGFRTLVALAIAGAIAYAAWAHLPTLQGWWAALLGKPQVIITSVPTEDRERLVMRTEGGLLEISTVKAYETFRREDPRSRFNVDLGTTVSEVRVAAIFRYHIALAKEWNIDCTPKECTVHAPEVTPTVPVAILSDETSKRTASGWARFNKNENLLALERELTPQLEKRASDIRNIGPAREAGRKTIAEFVSKWVTNHSKRSKDSSPRIVVLYPGESKASQEPTSRVD